MMRDDSAGLLTTVKVQSLIDLGLNPNVKTRKDLADAIRHGGAKISRHGVEAWFRHVDSNYNLNRPSLSDTQNSYAIPKRRWEAILSVFDIPLETIRMRDEEFRDWCFEQTASRHSTSEWLGLPESTPDTLGGREFCYPPFQKIVSSVLQGQAAGLTLEGDAGLGKSHVQEAFWRLLDGAPMVRLRTACYEGIQVPLLSALELLRSLSSDNQSIDAPWHKAAHDLRRRFDGKTAIDADQLNSLFVSLLDLFADICLTHPLIIFIDDIHWLDEVTARFINLLSRACTGDTSKGFGLLLATRPQDDTGRSKIRMALHGVDPARVTLQPLKPAAMTQVLASVMSGQQPDRTLTENLVEQSLGSPLIAIELLQQLQRNDALSYQDNVVSCHIPKDQFGDGIDTKSLYNGLFQSLRQDTQLILTTAAAYKRALSIEILQALFPSRSVEWLLDHLDEAERRGIIIYRGDHFEFRHALIRDAVYQSHSESYQAHIHASIAKGLRTLSPRQSAYHDMEVAHHMKLGLAHLDQDLVSEYCFKAAQSARSVRAWDQMIVFAQMALQLASPALQAHRGELLDWTGSALHMTGNPQAAIETLEQARSSFLEADDQPSAARVLAQVVRIRGNFGLVARDEMQDAEELASIAKQFENSHKELASRMYDALSARYLYARQPKQAKTNAHRSYAILRREPPSEAKSLAGIAAGVASYDQLELLHAEHYLCHAEESAIRCGDNDNIDRSRQRLALIAFTRGQFTQFDIILGRLRDSNKLINTTGEFGLVLAAQIGVNALRQQYDVCEAAYTEGLNLLRDSGYIWAAPMLATAIASARVKQGDSVSALSACDDLRDCAPKLYGKTADSFRRIIQQSPDWEREPNRRISSETESLDLFKVSRLAAALELAIQQQASERVSDLLAALEFAYLRNVRITLGWTILLPDLLSSAHLLMGNPQASTPYRMAATDLTSLIGETHSVAQVI